MKLTSMQALYWKKIVMPKTRTHVPCRDCGKHHTNPMSSSLCPDCGLKTHYANLQQETHISSEYLDELNRIRYCILSPQDQIENLLDLLIEKEERRLNP